jgi:uncharacterized cupin superfamily protein
MAGVSRFNLFASQFEQRSTREGYRWRATQVGHHLGSTRLGATLYELDDTSEWTFPYHFHHGIEELLYVVSGAPELRTDGGQRVLEPGDLVCFPSGERGAHAVRGPGRVLIVSTTAPTSVSVYPDSDKVGVRTPEEADHLNFRRADAVDYWEGE